MPSQKSSEKTSPNKDSALTPTSHVTEYSAPFSDADFQDDAEDTAAERVVRGLLAALRAGHGQTCISVQTKFTESRVPTLSVIDHGSRLAVSASFNMTAAERKKIFDELQALSNERSKRYEVFSTLGPEDEDPDDVRDITAGEIMFLARSR